MGSLALVKQPVHDENTEFKSAYLHLKLWPRVEYCTKWRGSVNIYTSAYEGRSNNINTEAFQFFIFFNLKI